MRAWLLLAAAGLTACGNDEVELVPSTQLTLRVHASIEAQLEAQLLRLTVNGENELGDRALGDVEQFPYDITLVAQPDEPLDRRIEVVLHALDAEHEVLFEDRVVTSFARGQQLVADLFLGPCGEDTLCEHDGCTGTDCLRCAGGSCAPTGFTDPAILATLSKGERVAPECPEPPTTCQGQQVASCALGKWRIVEECTAVCSEGACAGSCDPTRAAPRCATDSALVPLRCSDAGEWEPNTSAFDADGGCRFVCREGACSGECAPGTTRCQLDTQQRCDEDGHWQDELACPQFCVGSGCGTAPSCDAEPRCGGNESCCRALAVPGGSFLRSFDGVSHSNDSAPATLSPFVMDKYEVSVSRFRSWLDVLAAGEGRPESGAGRNPNDPEDQGWKVEWDALLAADPDALKARFESCVDATWSDLPDTLADRRPINCVDWYLAQAFCIWDGGRLPSEAEWNFAAAGGEEQRVFPWSVPANETSIDAEHNVYDGVAIAEVGTRPLGDGKWGHSDLAGNVREWCHDWFLEAYPPGDCTDCSVSTATDCRVLRGGAYAFSGAVSDASYRTCYEPYESSGRIGFRCVRSVCSGSRGCSE